MTSWLNWVFWVCSESVTLPLVVCYLGIIVLYKHWSKYVPVMRFQPGVVVHYCVCGVLNAVCVLGLIQALWRAQHHQPVGRKTVLSRAETPALRTYFTLFFLCKLLELLDTVYLLLSRRPREITPVHVYDHSMLVLLAEHVQRRACCPLFALPAIFSAFAHVFVYLFKLEKCVWPVTAAFARRVDRLRLAHHLALAVYAVYACRMRALGALAPPLALASLALALGEYFWTHVRDDGAEAARALQQEPKLCLDFFSTKKDNGTLLPRRSKLFQKRSAVAAKKNR